jgi:hypothetical protein
MRFAGPGKAAGEHATNVYSGVGEVMAVEKLTHTLDLLRAESRVKRAQLFTWDEASANNLIFVGGQVQNAAFAQLPKLQKFNLKAPSEEPFRTQGAVRNEKPASGEEAYYVSSDDLDNGVEYAIVALIPGTSPGRHPLILAGTNTYGTEAAADFVCNSETVQSLLDRLQGKRSRSIPDFEALLQVRVRGGAPLNPSLRIVYRRQTV